MTRPDTSPRAADSPPSGVAQPANASPGETRPRANRIFVGIKIADDIARSLYDIASALKGPGIRIVAASDLHLTLVPPWNETLPSAAIATARRVACAIAPFSLAIEHVGYAPDLRHPRFLWAKCAASAELAALRAAMLAAFGQSDDRPLRPHVTLARLRGNGRAIARQFPIERPVSFYQHVTSVELFQSPPPGENGYRVLGSVPLGEVSSPGVAPVSPGSTP